MNPAAADAPTDALAGILRAEDASEPVLPLAPRPLLLDMVLSLCASRKALFGTTVLLAVLVCALLSPQVAPFDPDAQSLTFRLRPLMTRSAAGLHLFGSDQLGRDILSRLIYGARVSMIVGMSVAFAASFVGVTLGLVAGYLGGWIDLVVMRLCDVQLALPATLLAIAVLAITGPSLPNLVLILTFTQWVAFARVIRAATLSEREREYVLAARALGFRWPRILFRYILPNVFAPVIVIATFTVAQTIIAETALSFLGLGIPPSIPSWGAMLADGRTYLATAWWLATMPGLFITACVVAINLMGDWLRDYLDPKLKV